MTYRPSDRLCQALQMKKVKGTRMEVVIGVAETEPKVVGDGYDKITYTRAWIGWSVCGVVVDDDWLINKYGLIKIA